MTLCVSLDRAEFKEWQWRIISAEQKVRRIHVGSISLLDAGCLSAGTIVVVLLLLLLFGTPVQSRGCLSFELKSHSPYSLEAEFVRNI
jgi:hypothetical protein